MRNLSLKGKSVVINTLVLPIIYYQCAMLPTPNTVIKEVDTLVSSFLWNDKVPKISRATLEQTTAHGGIGLHNFSNRIKAAKLNWLKRLAGPISEPWQLYFEFKMDVPALELARRRRVPRRLSRSSPFFAEIFKAWLELQ